MVLLYMDLLRKYNKSIKCIDKCEELIHKYRLDNHENKNQLLIIRGLNNSKDIKSYIDHLLVNDDDNYIDRLLNQISCSYIRAILYNKIVFLKKNNIDVYLYIDKNISSKLFINMDKNTIYDISKILGIIIDNAYDECINSKRKSIYISIYKSHNIEFSISNTVDKDISLDRIFNMGYSTKGDNHGYGLSIVKDIVKKNKRLYDEVSLDNKRFTQIIKVKI